MLAHGSSDRAEGWGFEVGEALEVLRELHQRAVEIKRDVVIPSYRKSPQSNDQFWNLPMRRVKCAVCPWKL